MESASKKLRTCHRKGQATGAVPALLKTLIKPEWSDMVFLCKDGERVHAQSMFVVGRSRVFKSMTRTGTAESKHAEISLPDISSQTLLFIFNFLYTGVMFDDDHEQQPSWTEVFEVLVAAKFFFLEEAVEIVWEYLEDMVGKIAELSEEEDFITAAQRLSVAMKFRNLWDGRDFVPRALCKILSTRPLEPLHLVHLSMEALLYFLMDLNGEKKSQAKPVSFEEYVKLRTVILWCVCQVSLAEGLEASISHLPGPYLALKLLEEPSSRASSMERHCPPTDASHYIHSLLLRSQLEPSSTESLLSMIDLHRVHPEILVVVVEPLAIFLSSKMLDAYRLHSNRRHPVGLQYCGKNPVAVMLSAWEHGPGCQTTRAGDDYVIKKLPKPSLNAHVSEAARCTLPLCRSYGIYEWDVILEKSTTGQLQGAFPIIGIVHEKDLQAGKIIWQRVWSFTMDVSGQSWVNDPRSSAAGVTGRKYGKTVLSRHIPVVKVHVNMYDRSCSFSYQDQAFEGGSTGLTFENMPRGVYFPVLGLRDTSEIRIKLVRGFRIS